GNLIEAAHGFTTTGNASLPSYTEYKDKRLFSLLQTNSSKVVDENGEPLVVYHGSRDGGFSIFNDREGEKYSDAPQGSSWFTSDRRNAFSYSGESKNVSYEEEGAGIYEVFLNIRNPYIEDFEGASWDGETYGKFSISYVDEYGDELEAYQENGSPLFDSYEAAESFAESKGFSDFEINDSPRVDYNVNEVVENVFNGNFGDNNDGVIILNVLDSGRYDEVEANDYIVSNSNQIKSAIDNNGEYSGANDDILFRDNSQVNGKFNEELEQQINGTLPKGHVYALGMPGAVLRAAGVDGLPIELSASRLEDKASAEYKSNHPFVLESVKNLPNAINNPIAVFDSKTKRRAKVVLVELSENGNNFVVVLQVRKSDDSRKIDVEVNSISLYPKESKNSILNWINEGLLRWVDKNKAIEFFSTQEPNYLGGGKENYSFVSATKIVENFENPNFDEKSTLFGANRINPKSRRCDW
ncbi:MAG: hypothetical protein R3Y04_07460, partial [Rikenellaceae bacterium]